MKICHFWWANHTHIGGSYYMVTNDMSLNTFHYTQDVFCKKKDQQGVPKISNKDPENFRIIASH